jgi:TorA maturation chaperone TorD
MEKTMNFKDITITTVFFAAVFAILSAAFYKGLEKELCRPIYDWTPAQMEEMQLSCDTYQ